MRYTMWGWVEKVKLGLTPRLKKGEKKMDNPFGANGEIKKEDDQPTIQGTEGIKVPEEVKESDPPEPAGEDVHAESAEVKEEPKVIEIPERLKRKNAILEEHGGLESNVPINSEYWRL